MYKVQTTSIVEPHAAIASLLYYLEVESPSAFLFCDIPTSYQEMNETRIVKSTEEK